MLMVHFPDLFCRGDDAISSVLERAHKLTQYNPHPNPDAKSDNVALCSSGHKPSDVTGRNDQITNIVRVS